MIESIRQAFFLWTLRICVSGLVALAVILSAIGFGRLLGEKVRQLAKTGVLAIVMACVAVSATITNGYPTNEDKEECRQLQQRQQQELRSLGGILRPSEAPQTVGGSVTYVPRTLPFAHDGFGQDEEWIRANFTNAEDIISIGYADWVDAQVGIGLTNGLYKFTATFTEDPPETTLLMVGDYSVAVTNAGEYSFVMEKGREYEFRTEPYLDGVDYGMQDDLLDEGETPMLMSWWGGSDTPGEWSVDGGWHWLCSPESLSPGWFGWMPTLRGSSGIDHIVPNNQGMTFEAILSDCSENVIPSFAWTASNDEVHFTSPNEQSTGLTFDSFPSWNSLTLTVQANLGGCSLWSSLYPTYGTNDTLQVHLALSVPKGVAVGGIRRKLTAAFDSDIETNGCVVLRCIKGIEGIEMWSAPSNGVSVASSNLWQVEQSHVFTCYLQGNAKSEFEGVEFEYQFVPEGGSRRGVTAKSTVFECYTQPINNTHYSGLHVINPSFLNPQSNAVFRVTVAPNNIPASEIQWSENSGSAMFPGGNTGTEVEVLGISGMADLEIKVLGTTGERMHFKAKVEQ